MEPHVGVAVGTCVSLHAPRPDPYVRLSRIRLVWDFLCQATSTPFLSCFVIPFFCSIRAASILSSRPHVSIAVCAQRRSRTALLQRRRRLVLDGRKRDGKLPAIQLPYTRQRLCHASLALSPVRALLV